MKNVVEHIDIPFDQLGIFKSAHEQKYQNILMQTLLLSTLAEVNDKKRYKASIFITVKSIWIVKKDKIIMILPVRSIQGVVKSYQHPQMVLVTRQDVDNLRLITSSQQRCWYIISTLCYVFTYVFNKQLVYITVKEGCLDYFQRSSKQKQNNKNINLQRYPKQLLKYQKPFNNIEDIYGSIKQKSKIILQKQLQIQTNDQLQNHSVYLARIKNQNQSDPMKQDRYICHYVQKKQQYLQNIYQHHNIQFITQLIYAKTTDFKLQIFFQFSKTLRGTKINPVIFYQIWKIYDKVKNFCNSCVFSTDGLLVVQRNKVIGENRIMNTGLSESQEEKEWIQKKRMVVMRQFRYQFLNQIQEWDKFMYQMDEEIQQKQGINIKQEVHQSKNLKIQSSNNQIKPVQQPLQQKQQILTESTCHQSETQQNKTIATHKNKQYFHKKCFNLGLILFQLTTGRHLFSYTPAFIHQQQLIQQQIQLIVQFKQIVTQNIMQIDIFPKFLDLGIDMHLKDFIIKCIGRKFQMQSQLWKHPWIEKYSKKHNLQFNA